MREVSCDGGCLQCGSRDSEMRQAEVVAQLIILSIDTAVFSLASLVVHCPWIIHPYIWTVLTAARVLSEHDVTNIWNSGISYYNSGIWQDPGHGKWV